MIDIDSHISRLEAIDPGSHAAPGDVLSAVADFNADRMSTVMPGLRQGTTPGTPERLKDWLDKLTAKVREAVASLSDVASISITVGSPFTVSVSVTFAGPSAAS
jgi:hypothetical protein